MPEQLILPFEVRAAQGRSDFIVAACNEAAVRFIDRWPDWPVATAAIYGPPGSGKSHLVQVWRALSGARAYGPEEFALDGAAGDGPLAVEDVDRRTSAERDRALMALFETGAPLLLTGERHPIEWVVTLPDLKSRLAALPAFPLWMPDEELLRNLARKLFADRQLAVPDAVISRMLKRLPRTPDAVQNFIVRLDNFALAERRAISERLVGELLDREGA